VPQVVLVQPQRARGRPTGGQPARCAAVAAAQAGDGTVGAAPEWRGRLLSGFLMGLALDAVVGGVKAPPRCLRTAVGPLPSSPSRTGLVTSALVAGRLKARVGSAGERFAEIDGNRSVLASV